MSERLHYFNEATTPVAFDCDDSDIDSDLDDLSRRPITDVDRAKIHARQLQLWSDEARRRRSLQPAPPPAVSPRRRPSSASLHDVPVTSIAPPQTTPISPILPSQDPRTRLSADRQQSNLSERARHIPNPRVSRSPSAKNLRIRITPSSSSKSLVSDIESELGQPLSPPQSPKAPTSQQPKHLSAAAPLQPILHPDRCEQNALDVQKKNHTQKQSSPNRQKKLTKSLSEHHPSTEDTADTNSAMPNRRMSFSRRVMRFSSLKRFLRRQ